MPEPRILIAEDEPSIALSLEFVMRHEGYAVECVDDGEKALQRAADDPPDLMLLDVMLPGLSGFDVCQRLRALPQCRDLPIVMLTARGREAERSKGLALGATAYVAKPFSVQALAAEVRNLLKLRAAR